MPKIKSQSKNWQRMKLGEVAQDVREPYEPKKTEEKLYIGLEHIEQQTLQLSGVGRSNETQSTKKIFKSGDILFGTLRPYFRKVTKPKFDGVCSTDITVIRPTRKGDGNFLKYFIANQNFIDYASNISGGTRMPRANWKSLQETIWLLPELNEQKNIGDVLSTYDDIIENNIKRIKILEEMAQAIYKEWFIKNSKLKNQKAKLQFKVKKMGDVFDVRYGKNLPTSKINKTGKYSVYGAGGVIGFYGEQNSNGKVTLVTCRGNGSGTVWRTRGQGFVTNNSLLIIPKKQYEYLAFMTIYFMLLNANVNSAISGSAQPQITIESLNFVDVVLPPEDLIKQFQVTAEHPFELMDSLFIQNQNLRQARDLLLPKLVGGEIEVK